MIYMFHISSNLEFIPPFFFVSACLSAIYTKAHQLGQAFRFRWLLRSTGVAKSCACYGAAGLMATIIDAATDVHGEVRISSSQGQNRFQWAMTEGGNTKKWKQVDEAHDIFGRRRSSRFELKYLQLRMEFKVYFSMLNGLDLTFHSTSW